MSKPKKHPKTTPQDNISPNDGIAVNAPNATADEPLGVAGVWVRLMAVLYDGMLVLALLFLVSAVLIGVGTVAFDMIGTQSQDAKELPAWYRNLVLSPSFVLTLFGFYGIFWKKSGQTLGMQTWRLKTVTSDGKLLTWGQSFVRIICACVAPCLCTSVGYLLYRDYLGATMSGVLGFLLNYLFCVVHPKGLAIQDWLSNTVTVRIAKFHHQSLFSYLKK